MFLKSLKLTRTSFLTTIVIALHTSTVYGLDLKVDLPQNAGKEPVLYYNPIVDQQPNSGTSIKTDDSGKIAKNKKKDNKNKKNDELTAETQDEILEDSSIPPPPENLVQNKKKNQQNLNVSKNEPIKNAKKSRQMRDETVYESEEAEIVESTQTRNSKDPFPALACIADNVAFWERVYTEIDVNDAFLHDKNDLGIIYSSFSLASSKALRNKQIEAERKKYTNILNNLANKLKSSAKKWNADEKRVAALFKPGTLTTQNVLAAIDNLRVQTGLKTQFDAGVQRSINYLPTVYPIIKNSGLPLDIVFLPHVESSYNSKAGSKVGAMGLWQIMPNTMKLLEGKNAVSKRTDPKISTRAAMKLLKSDYDKVQNWPLTLTAYNHGVNGMLRAIDETGSRDLCKVIDHYSSPSFKFASSNFYAQFLAARKVAMKKYAVIAKKKSGGSSLVLRRTILSNKGGSIK
ncbi:lytic transglycosylase domain-containing protein [Pigmentibacter sp. JX0631]|uniref:lytic transglycosylase domain-containing protein n=1 Tax=Pigmentibacter sp. JX0631 TaxID=2976982 RepID=UPI002468F246|nr:lytic transglycosylase domain-containing protein [Pigmentibacter sp. JX0631]WGL60310.1 lytic transglycosylase domain-containing protein [Pigmentibacter sp. JX0631]